MSAVASPCINVCALDPATGWCFGCGRTWEEIAAWLRASDAEKRAILARLPERLAALKRARDAADAKPVAR